jgi:hypothetical protein
MNEYRACWLLNTYIHTPSLAYTVMLSVQWSFPFLSVYFSGDCVPSCHIIEVVEVGLAYSLFTKHHLHILKASTHREDESSGLGCIFLGFIYY